LLMAGCGARPADRPDEAAARAEAQGRLPAPAPPPRPTARQDPRPPVPRPAEPPPQRQRQARDDLVLGIDLGTASCMAAVLDGGRMHIIIAEDSPGRMPSAVAITEDGHWLVGSPALRQKEMAASRTFLSLQLLLGRRTRGLAR